MNRNVCVWIACRQRCAWGRFGGERKTNKWPADDLTPGFKAPAGAAKDYEKRVVMVPMRDGVKLYTGYRGAEGCA